MDKKCKDKLLACRTYAQAKPILETQGVSVSGHELMHTAYAIQENQPDLARSFKQTVIQEMNGDVGDDPHAKKTDTDDRDEIKEVDGGTSHESSSTTGLEKMGTEQSAPEGASEQPDKKDQMGVAINEMGMPYGQPPPQGGIPPAGGMPPQQPPMAPPAPKPPMPQQQMMQYAVQETMRQFAPYYNKMVEAIKAIDKKVQETQKGSVKSLEMGDKLGGKGTHSQGSMIRETVDGTSEKDLMVARSEITRMNKSIDAGIF